MSSLLKDFCKARRNYVEMIKWEKEGTGEGRRLREEEKSLRIRRDFSLTGE